MFRYIRPPCLQIITFFSLRGCLISSQSLINYHFTMAFFSKFCVILPRLWFIRILLWVWHPFLWEVVCGFFKSWIHFLTEAESSDFSMAKMDLCYRIRPFSTYSINWTVQYSQNIVLRLCQSPHQVLPIFSAQKPKFYGFSNRKIGLSRPQWRKRREFRAIGAWQLLQLWICPWESSNRIRST